MQVQRAYRIPFRPGQCPRCRHYRDPHRCTAYAVPSQPSPLLAVLEGHSDEPCPRFAAAQASSPPAGVSPAQFTPTGSPSPARPAQAAPMPATYPPGPVAPSQPAQVRELEVWERRGESAGLRFSAFLVDLIATLLIASIPISMLLFLTTEATEWSPLVLTEQENWALILIPILYVTPVLYFTLLEGSVGTTLGKAIGARPAASLRVVRKDGSRCGFGRALIRALLWPFEANLLGAIVIAITERNQRIGDLIAGTLVVDRWKLLAITFLRDRAVFEFADGRRVAVSGLRRGEISKWLRLSSMNLDGQRPDGQPVHLRHLRFPSTLKRERVRRELEQFFRIPFQERVEWWRLFLILLVLLCLALCALGVIALGSLEEPPVLFPARATDTPRASPQSPLVVTRETVSTGPSPTADVAAPILPAPTDSLEPRAIVTHETLNVRAGPGTNYDKIGLLREGDEVGVRGRNGAGSWLAITLSDGTQGWVYADYVDLDVPRDSLDVAQTPSPPTPSTSPTPAPPTPTPSVDEQIAEISKDEHGELSQPGEAGQVAAGGEAEVTIVNDTPYALTLLIGAPNSVSVSIEACGTCKVYNMVGPLFCPEEGRPKRTLRLKPGSSQVAAKVSDPSVIPFYGTWELKADTGYFNCFYIVTTMR